MRWVSVVLALSFGLVAATHGRLWSIPDRHNPWAPLHYADAPNWLTGYKLARLTSEPQACLAALEETSWRFRPLPDRDNASGCGWRNAVQVQRTSVEIGPPFTLSCPMAVSTALWERHVVQPQAHLHFGVPVRRLEHWGIYACRDVAGGAARRSEHATANALDVAGFVLQDGRRVGVARDWAGEGVGASFLRAVHAGA